MNETIGGATVEPRQALEEKTTGRLSPEERAAIAARNRERMPETARVVDEFRRVFGPGVKLLWAQENGHEVGKRGPPGVPISPPQLTPEDLKR